MKRLTITILLFIIWGGFNSATKAQSLEKKLADAMELQRKGEYFKGTFPFKKYYTKQPGEMLSAIEKYQNDTISRVRYLAYSLVNKTGMAAADSAIKIQAVNRLVNACLDSDAGIRKNAAGYLKKYEKADFSPTATDTLVSILNRDILIAKNVIRLVGFVEPPGASDKLRELLSNPIPPKYRWEVQLALARLGDDKAIDYCLETARNAGINDRVVFHLLPDLVYTRQRDILDYIIDILQSDEPNCSSPNPDLGGKIPCGYAVMEIIAPVIIDFPIGMSSSGMLETDDYEQALQTVRLWFDANRNIYEIDKSTF